MARRSAAAARLLADAVRAACRGLLEERADGLLALDPAVDVDLDEAMALVRTLADAAGRPDGVPADLPRARALLAADILPGGPPPRGSPSSGSGSARSG